MFKIYIYFKKCFYKIKNNLPQDYSCRSLLADLADHWNFNSLDNFTSVFGFKI